jgi:uncharacterized Zn finger protein
MGYDDWRFYPKTSPKKVEGGIKAKSKKGAIGETWWSQKWVKALESFGWENRLQRGKSYARRGQVIDFRLYGGRVDAEVQGSRPRPYDVLIKVQPFTDKEWDNIIGRLAGKAVFAARLLAGEMPENIEEVFEESGKSLFPKSSRELTTDCSCPDHANPCKHIAAVYYILAEEFDRDPFMIFKFRGMSKENLLDELKKKRAGVEAGKADGTIVEGIQESRAKEHSYFDELEGPDFWTGLEAGPMSFRMTPPEVRGSLMKRLGKPQFWDSGQDFVEIMIKYYDEITDRAMDVAYGDDDKKS